LAWSRDSREVAITVNQELYIVPTDGGDPSLVCECPAASPAYLPDGRLTYVAQGQLLARDPSSGETTTLITIPGVTDASWSPDGHWVVVTDRGATLSLIDMSLSPPKRVQPQRIDGLAPQWSPSGDRFVYAGQSGHSTKTFRMELGIAASGEEPRLLHHYSNDGGWAPPTWSPDGSKVAQWIGDRRGTLWVFDADTGQVLSTTEDAEGAVAWGAAPGPQQ